MPPRILILTASVGEGHDLPALTLAEQLRAEHVDVDVVTEDALSVMGRAVGAVSEDAATIVFYRFQWVWDVGFWVFTGPRVTRSGYAAPAHAARCAGAAAADRRDEAGRDRVDVSRT